MKYKIRKGEHKARPVTIGLWKDKVILEKEVTFHESCKYDANNVYDSEDINKLFGIGYFPKGPIDAFIGRWITDKYTDDDFHHTDSARFGWTYNPLRSDITLHAYCYIDKRRFTTELLAVPLFTPVRLQIMIGEAGYKFSVQTANIAYNGFDIPFSHEKRWSYPLNLYFGGNLPAPHDMEVTIDKI